MSSVDSQTLSEFWTFFVYCLVVVTVVVFFLFYFNRALATVLSKIINVYAWRTYHAHIEIESIQFALLGGRILFKNLRYYSTNQSIYILKGHITMRYWLWHVRKEGDSRDSQNSKRPCRIVCNFQGVEWFMYNRTPAYVALKELLGPGLQDDWTDSGGPLISERTVNFDDPEQLSNLGPENSLFRRLMPVQLDITTGAITVGNPDLESIMVIEFVQANGDYNTAQSRSTLDEYRTSLALVLREPRCNLRHNPDYRKPVAKKPRRERVAVETTHWYNPFSYLKAYLHRRGRERAQRENANRAQGWQGLQRYRDDDGEEEEDQTEYAKVSQVLECSELTLTYYADVPGKVPRDQRSIGNLDGVDIGNGDLPPEWGVHITLSDGMLHYGPWPDRQRTSMFKFFFPALHRDMQKSRYLSPGQTRVHTAIKIYIEFASEMTVRVPLREASKNWKYGHHTTSEGPREGRTRPYGWIDMKADADSWIKFSVSTVMDEEGYSNTFEVHLAGLNLLTSTNYAQLLSAKRLKIQAKMHNPLVWNSERIWNFDFTFTQPHIYLLRDHLFLVQDLVKDWTAGPSTDLVHFVPTAYTLKLNFTDFQLNLCVNEHNIINNLMDEGDNAFMILKGQRLDCEVTLPFFKFEPESNKIGFDIEISNAKLEVSLPTSHTLGAFLTNESANFGAIASFSLKGTYEYYSFVDPKHLESLTMFMKGKGVTVKLFGFIVRYFLILRENYFGTFINFSTLDEYRYQRDHPEEAHEMAKRQAEAKEPSDLFEVFLSLIVEDGSLVLPENLYDRANSSLVEFQELQLELRVLDIYLDMYVNSSPLTWTREGGTVRKKEKFKIKNAKDKDNQNYLYIDELSIYAHRLFGPRPLTTTYVCRWQFDVGTISGQVKPSFLLGIATFGKTFLYNMVDEDNALPPEFLTKPEPDVTFLKASIKEIDVALWGRQSATQISLKQGLNVDFDDLVNEKYNQKVILVLPQLAVKSLANTDYYKSDSLDHPWVEVAHLDTSLDLTFYRSTTNWQELRHAQQSFIRSQDIETRRCPFLYETEEAAMEARSMKSHVSRKSVYKHHVGTLYAPPLASKYADEQMTTASYKDRMPTYLNVEQDDGEEGPYEYGTAEASSSQSAVDRKVSIVIDDTSVSRRSSKSSKHSRNTSKSTSTDSFKTASDGEGAEEKEGSIIVYESEEDEEDNSEYSYDEDILDQRNDSDSEFSYDVESDEDAELLSPASGSFPAPPAIPPSIPYRSYLKRYRVHRSRPYGNTFFTPYVPPPRTYFLPATVHDAPIEEKQQEQEDEHSNSAFFKAVNSSFASLEQMNSNEPVEDPTRNGPVNGNEVTMTIVLESVKTIKVLLTPIFVKIVQEVTEAINVEDWNLETMLDTTQIDYMGQLTRYLTDKFICTRFAVSVPKVHLHFIQDVMLPDDLTKANEDHTMIRTRYDLSDTVLCSADVILDQLTFIGSVKFQDLAFDPKQRSVADSTLKLIESRAHVNFNGLNCKVRFVSSSNLVGIFGIPVERQHHNSYGHFSNLDTEPVVIDVAIDQFHFKWLGATQPNFFRLDVNKISAIIINESVEILVGAVTSWLAFVGDLNMILNDFSERRSHQLQAFIAAIADFAREDQTGTDPVFLTRPSNVLRMGARNFRNDVGWKLLAHMRHLLRMMPTVTAEELQRRLTSGEGIKNIDSKRLFKDVIGTFSQWRSWEIGDISRARLFTQPFNQNNPEPANNESDPIGELIDILMTSVNLGHIRVGKMEFCIFEEDMNDDNSIIIATIEVDVDSEFREDQIAGNDGVRRSTDSDRLRQAVLGYLDVICRLRIGLIDITVNPTILAFSKHMLKVQRVFAAKLAALDAANRKTKAAVSATKPTAESSVQAKESKRMSGQTTTTLDQHQAAASTFNVKVLMSRLDVLAQVLIAVDQVMISASAQNLSMKNEVAGVQASALFSNPRLTSWPLEKVEADNVSGIRSSHKGSRKSDKYSNRLIVSMTGGVENVITYIEEKTFTSAGVGYNTLLSLNLAGISSSAAMSRQSQKTRQKRLEQDREIFNVLFTIAGVSIKLPQSLLKLYNFVEGWSAENLRSYDFLFKNLMDEWEEQRKGSSSNIVSAEHPAPVKAPAPTTTANREIKIQCLLKNLAFQSDLLPSLNLQYEAWNIFFMLQQSLPNLLGPGLSYACQLSKQEIRFVTRSNSKNKAERLRIDASEGQTGSWAIPVIRAIGNIRALEPEIKNVPADSRRGSGVSSNSKAIMPKLNSYLSLDFVSLALDVSMIDHLLTAQSLVGNEINEVLDLFSFAKRRKESGVEHTVTTPTPSSLAVLLYSIEISLRGLRVMALSPAAIGFFESNILSGFVTNAPIARNHHHLNSDKLAWKVSAHNFSLSLNHNTGDLQDKFYEDANTRSYRLAYIVIDVALQNYRASPLEISKANTQEDARVSDDEVDSFFLQFPKIHAVMQPIALGKLTDLYIYYDTELKRRSQKKADEIEKLAANTRRILQSLDVEVPKVTENSRSLLEERLISLQISKFAAAIPLDSRDDVISITTEAPSEVGALLLSVASIDFLTRKWETSCAKMGDISIQFVTRFDQSKEEHFAPNYHHKMNRISFPSISCEVHAGTVQSKQHIWIDAKVDGFEVDVDGTIVHHVNTLNDIYRSSLARVNAFTAETNFGLRSDENRVKIEIQQPPESKDESPKITFLDIEGSFVYCAGVCKLYPKSHSLRQSSQSSRKSTPGGKSTTRTVTPPVPLLTTGKSIFASSVTMDDARRAESGVAEIHIPGLSAWATYQTPMGDNAASSTIQKGAHVEVVIHPSENKLHPSLVPFLQEVVAGLKIGMQQSSEPKVESSSMTPISPIVGMNFSLYLQLSKTRLGLSCQPISKVMCELNWEEGNFLMGVASTDDNIQTMTCVGQIRGASGNVRHMFSPEPCLSAELKDILFNVMLMTRRTETVNDDSISIVIDIPHILADLNIRHLQDLFLLQSVWLDQSIIDIMSGLPEQPKSPSASPSSNGMDGVEAIVNEQALATPKPFAKYFAVRLQRLDLSSDLGQAIGKVSFTTKNAKINTRDIPGHRKSIRASTDIIHLKSEGRLVGTASMEGLFLDGQFERPAFDCVVINGMSLAKLTFKTSQILASLEYEYQKILVASIDPIHLTCSDVWSEAGLEAPSAIIDVYVSLDTVVVLGSVKTIPVFINMSDKLIALVEEKRALAESSVKTRVLKVELAPGVSELSKSLPTNIPAIVTPVEIALKEWLIRPQGKMVLDLHTAKLTVFPNHFYDADCVQINAKDMHIDLMRDVVDPVREHRDLNVQLKNATLLKSQTKKVTRTDEKNMTTDQWFDHANSSSSKNIFGIPTTKLTMETWQTFGDKKIEHRFVTVFDGRVDIALNFGLIKYLQDLATLYAEQIKKSAPTGASSETPRSPAANPPALPPWENPGDPAAAAAGAKIISLPPATDPSSSTISTGELTFHPIEPVKLDPQLRVMGDATPPLEWVGVQRQKIPALVHTELTLNLEKILLVLQGLYKSQLSEMVRMTQ